MSQNPYLINTGGLFGLPWGKSLKDSYAFSQIIYITNILMPLNLKNIEDFKREDFRVYGDCKKLVQNLKSLMQNNLDTIAGYETLKFYYNEVSKKIEDYFILKKTKYDKAILNLNCFITDTNKYQEHNAASQLMNIKKDIEDYFDLLISLDRYNRENAILSHLAEVINQQELNDTFFSEEQV